MTVLDTDFLVSLLRGDLDAADLADQIVSPKTTIINAFELYYGAMRSKRQEASLSEVSSLLESIDVLGLEKIDALKAAEVQAELMNEGKPVNVLDTLIAGIVLANNEEILTRNTDHFSRIPGLRWRSW